MEGEQYAAIYGYLEHITYPAGSINEIEDICIVYKSCKNFKLLKGKLFYKYVGKYAEAVPLKESAVSVVRGIYATFIADKVHLFTSSLIKENSLLTR